MKLLLRSHSHLLVAVRHVPQEHRGKQTPGMDGQVALTPAPRVHLGQERSAHTLWKAPPARRVYIPKAPGKLSPLGMPTRPNRVAQARVKHALEPSWEARFEASSSGFRPGRSGHDAIEPCHSRLRAGQHGPNARWLLDADSHRAYDTMSHDGILARLGAVPGREVVQQWRKAGDGEAAGFHPTPSGPAQGAVISPLLANIALDGMDNLLHQYRKVKESTVHSQGRTWRRRVKSKKYGCARYGDGTPVQA